MSKLSDLSVDDVRRALDYNPETGSFTWKPRPDSDFASKRAAGSYRTQFEGRPALTCIGVNGYQEGRLKGAGITGHRVAFVLMTGEWPSDQVDHINGNRSDNRWCNLRSASQTVNSRNMAMQSRNTSGRIGIHFDHGRKKWVAQGRAEGRHYNLGRFDTMEAAITARTRFETEFGFHPNHGRIAA